MVQTSDTFKRVLEVVRGAAVGGLLHVFLATDPAPASRPRLSHFGGVHYGETYSTFYADCQRQLAFMKADVKVTGVFDVLLEFIVTKPKTGKMLLPRGDVDNFAKGPMDAITKAEKIWKDDSQVSFMAVTKRYAAPGESPGVNIYWNHRETP